MSADDTLIFTQLRFRTSLQQRAEVKGAVSEGGGEVTSSLILGFRRKILRKKEKEGGGGS